VNALVVDDSSAMRRIEHRALERAGWRVTEASCGHEALDRLRAAPCELVLADLHMPDMDGFELVRRIRADAALRGVRVVMVTSDAVLGSVQEALAAGADDFLMKPFTAEALAERVAEVMR